MSSGAAALPNSSPPDISGGDYGVAIYSVEGNATISNVTFDDNDSKDGCGAVYNGG